jgi:hypothetical protein
MPTARDRDAIHHDIDVKARPSEIWAVFSDLTTWPLWFPRATVAHPLDGCEPWRRGGAIEVEMAVPVIGSLTLRLDVEEIEIEKSVRWIGKAYGVRGDHRYSFVDRGGWTRVTSHETFGGVMSILATRVGRARFEEEAFQSLDKLRAVVESRNPAVST